MRKILEILALFAIAFAAAVQVAVPQEPGTLTVIQK